MSTKEKPQPTILEWVTCEEASQWPEGAVAVHCVLVDGQPDWNTAEFSRYHRPDWLRGESDSHKLFKRYHFALLVAAPRTGGEEG